MALRTDRIKVFNSIGFIGLVVFCAVVLTSLVFSAPAPVAPPLTKYLSEWSWLMQAEPLEPRSVPLLQPADPKVFTD
jgi:hypothetical protein